MTKKKSAPAPAPSSNASAARLPLIIVGLGLLAVLAIGGTFVWLNMSNAPKGPPGLSSSWMPGATNECRGSPAFPLQLGFSRAVVFSTSERLNKGMQLIEPGPNGDLNNAKTYQHPSWTMGGYLGVFAVDRKGNVYVVPSPRISLLDNPPEKQNIIYEIDSQTGVMSEYINLPTAQPPSPENPFGALALTYDCDTNSLYVTTVMGSTRAQEVGRIYRVDLNTGKVAAEYDNTDGFGVATYNLPTGKRLYFGSARGPAIRSLALDTQGNFWGEPQTELVLTGPYNRARRIQFTPQQLMQVRGIDFNFTLAATSEERRTDYQFSFDPEQGKWVARE